MMWDAVGCGGMQWDAVGCSGMRCSQECHSFVRLSAPQGSLSTHSSVPFAAQLQPQPLRAERLCGHTRPPLPMGRLLCQQVNAGHGGAATSARLWDGGEEGAEGGSVTVGPPRGSEPLLRGSVGSPLRPQGVGGGPPSRRAQRLLHVSLQEDPSGDGADVGLQLRGGQRGGQRAAVLLRGHRVQRAAAVSAALPSTQL